MISPFKLVTVLAATLLATLPSISATCVTQGFDIYNGNYGNYNTSSRMIYSIRSPAVDRELDAGTTRIDSCQANCASTVVVRVGMETIANQFYIAINGRYLLNNYSWSIPQTSTLPRSNFANRNTCPADTMIITLSTARGRNTQEKFFTGEYLWRQNYFGTYQPIYAIEFPHWQCPSRRVGNNWEEVTNYVQVANKLDVSYYGCGWDDMTLRLRRSCNPNVLGDPQFAGLRGQDYQVHGIDGAVYNLISAPALSVTSRFVYLDGPRECPIMPSTGQKSKACFAHKGSYLDNIAIINNAGAKILIQSGPASSGLARVEIDGKPVKMGAAIDFGNSNEVLHYNSTHEVTVVAGVFTLEIENSDGFVNIRSISLKSEAWPTLKSDDTHGLLGQTWRKSTSKKVIEGRVDDYLIESGDLFGTDFMYNRYLGAQN